MLIIPRDETRPLVARYYYCDGGRCYYSNWYSWQRWLLAGGVLLFVLLLIFACSCLSARRRRRRGLNPYWGTAWIAPPPAYDVNNIGHTGRQHGGTTGTGYNTGNQYASHNYNSPPVYSPPSNGYYAGQQGGTTGNPQPGYEMGGVGNSSGYNNYDQPRSPPPAHVTHVPKY